MRTIDADRLNAVVNETLERLKAVPLFSLQHVHLKTAFQTLTDMINNAPTIDAVPIVQCKDCKKSQNDELFGDTWCGGSIVDPEGYCHRGKRKDDE